jgi:hypothetical protein
MNRGGGNAVQGGVRQFNFKKIHRKSTSSPPIQVGGKKPFLLVDGGQGSKWNYLDTKWRSRKEEQTANQNGRKGRGQMEESERKKKNWKEWEEEEIKNGQNGGWMGIGNGTIGFRH